MEYFWTLFNSSTNSTSNCVRGNNGNCFPNDHAWDHPLDLGCNALSRPDWWYPLPNSFNYPPPTSAATSAIHALMFHDQEKTATRPSSSSSSSITNTTSSLYPGMDLCYHNPDPHLTCLKLGKRHYFEDTSPLVVGQPQVTAAGSFSVSKRGKSDINSTAGEPPAIVPRCQVDGCEEVLVNAKDYHRRHKVCEMHAKAPKVVVLGIEQRFCQQCSRFHTLAEFDEAKRSCRRRLAGHNERRRKSSQEQNSLARKLSQDMKMMGRGRQPHFLNNSDCALSLLSSSSHYTPWNLSTSPDLPMRCSAALRELIAENRASILACRQLSNADQIEDYKLCSTPAGPNHRDQSEGHVTLNLMQAPSSAFGLLSVHDHKSSKGDDEEDCCDLWKVPLGY